MINLIFASLIPRVFGVLATIVLARYLPSTEIALIGVFMSVIGIIAPLIGARLPLFITRVSEKNLAEILYVGFIFSIIVAFFASFLGTHYILSQIPGPSLKFVLLMVFFLWIIGSFIRESIEHLNLRRNRYHIIKNQMIKISFAIQLSRAFTSILNNFGVIVLFAHALTQSIVTSLILINNEKKLIYSIINSKFKTAFKNVFKSHGATIFLLIATQILSSLVVYSPIFLTSSYFSNSDLAYISLIMMIWIIPSKALFQSIGKYLFAEISTMLRTEIKKNSLGLLALAISLLPISIVYVFLSIYFLDNWGVVFLGDKWSMIHVYIGILSMLSIGQFCQNGTALIFKALNADRINLILNVFRLIVVIFSIFKIDSQLNFGEYMSIFSFNVGAAYLLSYFIAIVLLFNTIKINNKHAI